MRIDFPATRQNMAMLKIGPWAIANGFEAATVRRILGGNYPYHNGEKYKAVINRLRELGYLVEVHDDQAA